MKATSLIIMLGFSCARVDSVMTAPQTLEAPTVSGGMTVSTLRFATSGGEPSALIFGSGEDQFKMGVDSSGDFILSSPRTPVLSVSADDTLSIVAPHFSVKNLDLKGNLSVYGVPQFRMVAREDFTSGVAPGWDNKAEKDIVTQCAGIFMIGGYGKFAKGEVSKKITDLPPHSELRLKATYHYIDAWVGETGFARMNIGNDGSMLHVWTDRHSQDMEQQAVNVCGGATGEGKFAVPVDVSVPHNSDSVVIGFGSTLETDDPYDQSWGVSGIEIYIR